MAKSVFVIAIILALSAIRSTSITITERDLETEESLKNLFDKWVADYGMEGDLDDKAKRFLVFKDNVKYIHEFNKQGHSYHLGLNQFGAMTNEEFQNMYAGGRINHRRIRRGGAIGGRYMSEKVENNISTCFDWRQKGAVNPIKDMRPCGCSGAFSAVASVESMLFIRNVTNILLSLSEQELVDWGFFTAGCNGSSAEASFADIVGLGGLTMECAYPYTGKQGTCQPYFPVANISGVELVAPNNETAFRIAVQNQPISGIFNTSCGFNTGYAVTVVGYCYTIDGNYWIVRNSLGTSWGEGGYIRMNSDFPDPRGLCGILTDPSYPTNIPSPATSTDDHSYSVE
ncbi:hypothetical protein LUZ61_016670 [Rhynchospora tenuis]|uniref:Uncharacterized protein n=1 Tax=Rhynchospora tenuis TaxID=198213 RepID=A0AAD5Z602_9POAL|nr:hypothetical protein LUZ61_016670 [Rhynchospora tenuis]